MTCERLLCSYRLHPLGGVFISLEKATCRNPASVPGYFELRGTGLKTKHLDGIGKTMPQSQYFVTAVHWHIQLQ